MDHELVIMKIAQITPTRKNFPRKITYEEIRGAMAKLYNSKVPGPDWIVNEMLNYGGS